MKKTLKECNPDDIIADIREHKEATVNFVRQMIF